MILEFIGCAIIALTVISIMRVVEEEERVKNLLEDGEEDE